jgi:hypothetical protein
MSSDDDLLLVDFALMQMLTKTCLFRFQMEPKLLKSENNHGKWKNIHVLRLCVDKHDGQQVMSATAFSNNRQGVCHRRDVLILCFLHDVPERIFTCVKTSRRAASR